MICDLREDSVSRMLVLDADQDVLRLMHDVQQNPGNGGIVANTVLEGIILYILWQ